MLKCLVFPWKTGLLEITIAAWLSTNTLVPSSWFSFKSTNIFLNHKTWFTTDVATINLTLAINLAIFSYFLETHENTPEPSVKQYHEVIFTSSIDPSQSLSEKPYKFNFCNKVSHYLLLLRNPWKYTRTKCETISWSDFHVIYKPYPITIKKTMEIKMMTIIK